MTPEIASTRPVADDEGERSAYNAAFWRLGFSWQWDPATYRELALIPQEKERIRRYLERHQPHLLKAYDSDFLCEVIVSCKSGTGSDNALGVNCTAIG